MLVRTRDLGHLFMFSSRRDYTNCPGLIIAAKRLMHPNILFLNLVMTTSKKNVRVEFYPLRNYMLGRGSPPAYRFLNLDGE
jgi:hypothetical protein